MDWMQFIDGLIDSLAWPLTTIALVFMLKEKVSELLPRLERFKHKDTEIAFSKAMAQVAEDAEELHVEVSDELQNVENWLLDKAELYPNAVINQSYNLVQKEVIELMSLLAPSGASRLTPSVSRNLRKRAGVSNEFEENLERLNSINEMIGHKGSKPESIEEVNSFINFCIKMVQETKQYITNNQKQSEDA